MESVNYFCKDKKSGKIFYTSHLGNFSLDRHEVLGETNRGKLASDLKEKLELNTITEDECKRILRNSGIIITLSNFTLDSSNALLGTFSFTKCEVSRDGGRGKKIILNKETLGNLKGKETFESLKLKLVKKDNCYVAYILNQI